MFQRSFSGIDCAAAAGASATVLSMMVMRMQMVMMTMVMNSRGPLATAVDVTTKIHYGNHWSNFSSCYLLHFSILDSCVDVGL